jgi:hypothetical protein
MLSFPCTVKTKHHELSALWRDGSRPYPPDEPASPDYYAAVCLLDWLESIDTDEPFWADQLERSRRLLETAWSEDSERGPLASAYIEVEIARLEYLAGKLTRAVDLLRQARSDFRAAKREDKAAQVEDALISIGAILRRRNTK